MNQHTAQPRAIILTALPIEYQAVRAHLEHLREIEHPQGTLYESGMFLANTHLWQVAIVEMRMGNVRAAFEAERAITYFQPSVALLVGVAGGLKNVHIGDVVVAEKVYGYEAGKAGEAFFTRPEIGLSNYRLIQRAQRIAERQSWHERILSPSMSAPHAYVAPIAAGEKVVSSSNSPIWQLLRQQYEDALAVEMEGYGFLKTIHANKEIEALVIRGISDLIDGKSEADASGSQTVAARHASAFAFEVLAKLQPPSQQRQPSTQKNYAIHQQTTSGAIITPLEGHAQTTINHFYPPQEKQPDK